MRRLTFTVAAVLAVTETYRRGYMGACLFGGRQWCRARPDRYYEPEVVG